MEVNVNEPQTDAIKKIRSWLNCFLHIETVGNRSFRGQFICLDKQQNILLKNSCEDLQPEDESIKQEQDQKQDKEKLRDMGVLIVPLKYVESIQVLEKITTL
ncbi:hypothetical protein CYY_005226 [Polysphondylium violaceum]|uniref:LSM domain-containing protein n=1 Tax=Polysphondylium violaceum TaxID=133409 RepID=A0A8J4PTB5_9MYCE|nr:hypothetical protein CYY_005226 [Polysphondylium violaceum]